MKNLMNVSSDVDTITPRAITADLNGTGIDRQNADAVAIGFRIGVWTSGSIPFVVQDADLLAGPYAAVAAADLVDTTGAASAAPTITSGASDGTVIRRAYIGLKRFVRAAVVGSGGGPSLTAAVSVRGDSLRQIGPASSL